jgi:hypothetical protein
MSTAYFFLSTIVLAGVAASIVLARAQSAPRRLAAEVEELESKIAYLSDRQQIHDVYLRFMRGFDRNDVPLMRSAFWPDVQINYGSDSHTLDEFVAGRLKQHIERLSAWGHLLTNESVDIDGDVAHVEIYITAFFMWKDEKMFSFGSADAPPNGLRPSMVAEKDEKMSADGKAGASPHSLTPSIVGGRYIDRLDRRNGEWRIAVREFFPHFQLKGDANEFTFDEYSDKAKSGRGMGTLDRHDPSYLRPLKQRPDKRAVGASCAE